MYLTVYIDIVFCENFIMNYIILKATEIILKKKSKALKLFIASGLGAFYVIAEYIFNINILLNGFVKFILSIIITYLGFSPKCIRELIKEVIIFYLSSFVFGGVSFAILFFLNSSKIFYFNEKIMGSYALNSSLIGGIVGFVVIILAFKIVKTGFNKEDLYCLLKICINNKEIAVNAIVDSGNFLKEPISNCSVVIVEKKELKNIIPDTVLDNLYNIIQGKMINLEEYQTKIKIIPFNSVGNQHGMLLGIRGDLLKIEYKNENIIIKNFVIGIYDGTFSKTEKYHALIGLDIFNNGREGL